MDTNQRPQGYDDPYTKAKAETEQRMIELRQRLELMGYALDAFGESVTLWAVAATKRFMEAWNSAEFQETIAKINDLFGQVDSASTAPRPIDPLRQDYKDRPRGKRKTGGMYRRGG